MHKSLLISNLLTQSGDNAIYTVSIKMATQPASTPTNGVQKSKTEHTGKIHQLPAPSPKDPKPEETKKPDDQVKAQPKKSIEQVLHQINEQGERVRKLEKLRETKAELEFFRLGKEGLRENLQITDGQSHHFSTSYSPLLLKIHATIDAWVAEQITLIEHELLDAAA